MAQKNGTDKSLESWIWDAACSIRGAKDAPKYKDYILPLIFTKRLCDVFDDELNRITKEVGTRAKAFRLVKHDKKLVRFYLPLKPDNPEEPVWSIIRKLADNLDGRTKEITSGINRFTGPGFREYEALAADGRRTLNDLNRAVRSLERNPSQLIFGGKPTIPEYKGGQ